MPTVKYPNNPNTDTAFVTDDNGKRTRTLKTVLVDGTVDYPSNPNSSGCYVTIDGKKQRALMTADISSVGTVEFTNNSNSTKGYVTDGDGKKHRVILTAALAGGGSAPVIDELNVTPSTSAQTITAPTGTDGYSPVNVSAVDSTIDANIQPGNIKDGVSILGVAGTCIELNGETKTITPQTYGQTIYPTNPKNGITEISVNAVTSSIDANITAGNIKDGVSILGVTGNYKGNVPTGTKSITANGVYDVTDYASADVQVPTTAPALYREFKLNASGRLQPNTTTTHILDFSGVKDVDGYMLYNAYSNNTAISGVVDLSSLTTMSYPSAMSGCFYGCTGLTGVVDLSSLLAVSGASALSGTFNGCTGLTSAILSSLLNITGSSGCNSTFYGCTGLTSANVSSLVSVSAMYCCQSMFARCRLLTSFDFPSLSTITGSMCFQNIFEGCSALTRVSFYALTPSSFGYISNQFNNMLSGVTGCTVHFPISVQATIGSWADVTNGFGGTNTTVLFDIVTSLTGADSNTYTRKQKESTSTATAWTYNNTLYYTSGTTEPTVGATIYSDAACTTAVTTISSIA